MGSNMGQRDARDEAFRVCLRGSIFDIVEMWICSPLVDGVLSL